ncbi:uncharacterized protein [Procambarus clarkii]|uniref:uncharacterized protein n=1 Tax=Procambarus clarkii TaxID=6728 RepID=UPI0037435899
MDKVQTFVESGKPEDLEGCTRDQLKQIAEKCGIRLKASKVAGMKDEILRQLRARSEAAEQGAQEGAESRKEDDGQDEVRSQGSSRSSKSSRSSRSSRNRSLERFQLELQMQREERQFQLEKMKLELQMKNEAEKEKEKTRLEVEKEKTRLEVEKEKTRLEVEKEKTRVRELELEQEKEKEKARLEVEKEKEKTRVRELELEQEKEKAQVEKEKAQVEKEKERTKQMQIEANRTLAEQRIEHGLPESTTQVSHPPDVRVREKDIPLFVPEEAESFFEHFEKVASIKEWPQEEWAQLVQLRLTGAAREAYTQLSLEECQDYATVKSSILRSFQLTSEAYRKRFREMIKVGACTFAETARDLERRFQKWIEAAGVGSYADLKQLMVMEKFLEMMHPETKFKIQEAGIKEVKDAADRADMITEAYKSLRENRVRSEARRSNGRSNGVWGGRNYERPRRVWGEKNFDKWADKSKYPKTQKSRSRTSSESEDGGAKREANRYPGNRESSKTPQSASSVPGQRNSHASGQSQSYSGTYRRDFSQMRCYNCNGLGHVMRDCRQGKRVVTLAMCDPRGKYTNVFRDKPQRLNLGNERYRPFMSKGWISVGGQPEVEVGILRDTGANQSLITRSLIGNDRRLAGRSKMRVYGLLSESDMPVCTVQLRSEYVSAVVMLGVCPDIPIPGVQVILGNDLCGTKVLPRVIAETVPEESPEGHGTSGTPESVNLTDIRGDESGDRQAIEYPVSVVRKAEVADKEDAGEDDTVSIQPVEDIDVDIAWLFDEGPAQANGVSVRSKVRMTQPKKNHVKRADLSRAQTAEIKGRKVNATVLSRNEERCGQTEDESRASNCPRAQRHMDSGVKLFEMSRVGMFHRKRGGEMVKSDSRENERRRDSMCGEMLTSTLGEARRRVRSNAVGCSTVLEETFRERRRVEGEERELYRGERCGKRMMIQAWRNRGKPRTRWKSSRMRSRINEETEGRIVGEDEGVEYDDRRRKYNGSRWKYEDDRGDTDSRCLTLDVKRRRRGNGGWRQ